MATAVKKNRKIFVLDTNVLLHDYKCMHNFDEHDIIVPITVLEELDRFKKGNDMINYHAREFTRELDKLSGDKLFNGGLSLGRGKGKLSIETGKAASEKLRASFPENTPDHRILAIAEFLHLKNGAVCREQLPINQPFPLSRQDRYIYVNGAVTEGECTLFDRDSWHLERIRIPVDS